MTTSELKGLFVTALLRDVGGNPRQWRRALGEVRLYSIATHPHCNWAISPSGTGGEVDAIETLADRLRLDHPIVTDR